MGDCVVVLLDSDPAAVVARLWVDLERRWGARRSHAGEPHFTLAVLHGDPDPDRVRSALTSITAERAPLAVSGAGFGVFVGHGLDCPVVHLALTRTPALSALHQDVVESLAGAGVAVDGQSQPDFWRPHITLADSGVTATTAGEVMAELIESGPRHWTIEVDNLALVTASGEVAFRLKLDGHD
jgi:2'-5' RNA ligase